MNEEVQIFCEDCRGRFEVELDDLREGEIIECTLCGAELEVLQENPLKMKIVTEEDEDDFY